MAYYQNPVNGFYSFLLGKDALQNGADFDRSEPAREKRFERNANATATERTYRTLGAIADCDFLPLRAHDHAGFYRMDSIGTGFLKTLRFNKLNAIGYRHRNPR
jgi:hypothetical protein